MVSEADLLAFSLRQEAALGACEALKDAAVALLDARGPLADADHGEGASFCRAPQFSPHGLAGRG